MTKMIKIESCRGCPCILGTDYCEIEDKHVDPDKIDPVCTLEDYKQCDCEPFQSCEKCAKKTEWKNPKKIELQEHREYWILFQDNRTISSTYLKYGWVPVVEGDFLVAEIKPPEVPC